MEVSIVVMANSCQDRQWGEKGKTTATIHPPMGTGRVETSGSSVEGG